MVVFVVSTTGDGDPPDNVVKFWRKLKKKTLPSNHLGSCNYALLGKTQSVDIIPPLKVPDL